MKTVFRSKIYRKFHPGVKVYRFHPGVKDACKQKTTPSRRRQTNLSQTIEESIMVS